VAGTLDKQHPRRYFVARTRAGQRMSVEVTPRTRKASFRTQSTEAGDYLIRVDTNMMASNGDAGVLLLKVWIR